MSPLRYVRGMNLWEKSAIFIGMGGLVKYQDAEDVLAETLCCAVMAVACGIVLATYGAVACGSVIAYDIREDCLEITWVLQGLFRKSRPSKLLMKRSSVKVVREIRPFFSGRQSLTYMRCRPFLFFVGNAQLRTDIQENWKNVKCGSISFLGHIASILAMAGIMATMVFAVLYAFLIAPKI